MNPAPRRSLLQRFHDWLFQPFPDEPEEPKYRPGYSPEARAAAARHDLLMAESARVRAESASLRAERRAQRPLGMLVSGDIPTPPGGFRGPGNEGWMTGSSTCVTRGIAGPGKTGDERVPYAEAWPRFREAPSTRQEALRRCAIAGPGCTGKYWCAVCNASHASHAEVKVCASKLPDEKPLRPDAPRFREAPGFPAVVAALAPDGSLVASADTVTEHDRAVLAELQGTTLEGRGL